MKLIITSTASLALVFAAPAFAEGYKPPQEPKPPVVVQGDSGGADWLPLLFVVIGAAVIASSMEEEPSNPPCVTDQDYTGEKADPYIIHECPLTGE